MSDGLIALCAAEEGLFSTERRSARSNGMKRHDSLFIPSALLQDAALDDLSLSVQRAAIESLIKIDRVTDPKPLSWERSISEEADYLCRRFATAAAAPRKHRRREARRVLWDFCAFGADESRRPCMVAFDRETWTIRIQVGLLEARVQVYFDYPITVSETMHAAGVAL